MYIHPHTMRQLIQPGPPAVRSGRLSVGNETRRQWTAIAYRAHAGHGIATEALRSCAVHVQDATGGVWKDAEGRSQRQ